MEQYVANSFDKNYAQAWSMDQGGFSSQLAQNLIAYLNKNKIEAKSVLDICCGTGEFLSYFAKAGMTCAGTEVAMSMIDYAKDNLKGASFTYTKNIFDFPNGKFDIVTCNHDVVNMMEKFSEWETFFKNAYSSLNKGGVLMFDYYTKNKLANWNETIFEQSDNMDHVRSIKKGMDNKCIINEVYYIKNKDGAYDKTFDVLVDSYFENSDILNAIKNAGFSSVEAVDFSLEKISNIESRNRVHIIAIK